MQGSLTVPVLSVTADAVRDLDGQDAIFSLWNVFTKCKYSLQDGPRLENISWRLWHREMAGHHSQSSSCSSATTPSVELDIPMLISPTPSRSSESSEASSPKGALFLPPPIIQCSSSSDTLYSTRSGSHLPIGRIIFDHILPEKISSTLPPRRRAADKIAEISTPSPSTTIPSVVLPSTPPNAAYPKVIIVNPTPHPTPPATPQSMPMQQAHFLPQQYPINRPNVHVTLSTKTGGFLAPPPRTIPHLGANVGEEEPLSASAPKTDRHGSISEVSSSPEAVEEGSKLVSTKFFFKESPERFGSSSDRDGVDVLQSSDAGEGASSHGESSNAGKSVLFEKAPSSLNSNKTGSMESRSNAMSRRVATGIPVGARRKAGYLARPVRPVNHRMSSRFGQKKAKSGTNVAGTVVPNVSQTAMKRTTSVRSEGRVPRIGAEESMSPLRLSPPPPAILPTPPPPPMHQSPVPRTSDKPDLSSSHHQRRGIVVDNSDTDYETTDSEDLEWASEELSPEEVLAQKRKEKKKEEEERARREEEEKKKRDQELFAKLPRRSYAKLPEMSGGGPGQRTRSVGLLSQLMNPDPSIFLQNYQYRPSFSTQDMTQHTRGSGLAMSRASAAAPVAAQVNAPAQIVDMRASSGGKYRPRGRPEGAEMDDDSDDEDENKIELSASLAQQKLAALAGPHRRRMATEDMRLQQQLPEAGPSSRRYGLTSISSAPIPLSHPYNLPAPAAPSTPRTTRRQMLATELSESLRRNLLWERQISKVGGGGKKRTVSAFGGNGLRPLTAMNPPPNPEEGTSGSSGQHAAATSGDETRVASKEERRRNALIRNRSWADDYHYSGW